MLRRKKEYRGRSGIVLCQLCWGGGPGVGLDPKKTTAKKNQPLPKLTL
jgi:hypothetical protein